MENEAREIKKIEWGVISFKADPTVVYREMKAIGGEEGVNPEDMVEWAKENPTSELHKCFTWDDLKAAGLWRIKEARTIKANLHIVWKEPQMAEPIRVQAFMRDRPGGAYKETVQIFRNKDSLAGTVELAKRELEIFSNKYRFLNDKNIQKIIADIDELLLQDISKQRTA